MTPVDLRQARKTLRLTQAELGEALGVKPRTIWTLENQTDDLPRLYALAVGMLLSVKVAAE